MNILKTILTALALIVLSGPSLAADTKISAMTSAAPAQAADAVHVARAGGDFRLSVADYAKYIIGSTTGVVMPTSIVYPETYGAQGNGKTVFDGAFTAAGSTVAFTSATSTAPSTPTVTTVAANDTQVSIFLTSTGWTTTPSVGTTRSNITFTSSSYGLFISDQVKATAGTTTAVSGTLASNNNWQTGTIALIPSGGTTTFVASSVASSTSTNSLTLTKPTGTTTGDYMLMCMGYLDDTTPVLKVPAGFNMISGGYQSQANLVCYGKIAGASEPSSYAFSYAPYQNAGAAASMLTYRNTSGPDAPTTTLTSATAAFTSGAVGNLLCVAGISGSGSFTGQQCGTILTFSSSTAVNVSFPVYRTFSAKQFSFGTNDDTAFSTMLSSAPCSTTGCTVQLGAKHYELTAPISLVPNVPVNIVGVSPSVPNTANTLINGNTAVNANNGTQLQFMTQTMTQAGLSVKGVVNTTSTAVNDTMSHFALIGGAGNAADGGGADGLDVLNWQGAVIDTVFVYNFAGYGAYVDALTASSFKDYSENILFKNVNLGFNGLGGFKLGSGLAVPNLENTQFNWGIIEGNNGPAVTLAGANIQGFQMVGNTIQWNNLSTPNPEILVTGSVIGGTVENNYFEADTLLTSRSTYVAASGPFTFSGGMIGLKFKNNYYQPTSAYIPLVFSAAGTALPTCTGSAVGSAFKTATVTDSLACTIGTTYVSGGTTRCDVTCTTSSTWVETGTATYN